MKKRYIALIVLAALIVLVIASPSKSLPASPRTTSSITPKNSSAER